MRSDDDWTELGPLLDSAPAEVKARLDQARVLSKWAEIVGQELAEVTRPVRLSREILTIAVPSSVWAQELTLRRAEILDKVRPHLNVSDLRFVVEGK